MSLNMKFTIYQIKGYTFLVVLLSAFLLFYKHIMQVFPGLITNDIMLAFNISAYQAGILVAVTFWTVVIIQLIAGIILDKFGFRTVSSCSLIITSLGLLFFIYAADSGNLILGYFARVMIGCGIAFATVSYIKAVAIWLPPKKFAFVTSFLASAAMLGAIAGQAPLSYLIIHTGSWQKGLCICALIGFVVAIIYFLIIRDTNPMNVVIKKLTKKFSWKEIKQIFLNYNNWLLTFYTGFSFTTIDTFAGLWGNNYFREQYNLSTEHAAWIISIIFVGLAIGSPVIGKLSEKFNSYKLLMLICHFIATITITIVLSFNTSPLTTVICLFLFGFCLGTYMLAFAIGRRINNITVTATVAAFINTGEPILGGFFDPLIGYLLEIQWKGNYIDSAGNIFNNHTSLLSKDVIKYFTTSEYQSAFSLLTLSMIIAFCLLCLVKDYKT